MQILHLSVGLLQGHSRMLYRNSNSPLAAMTVEAGSIYPAFSKLASWVPTIFIYFKTSRKLWRWNLGPAFTFWAHLSVVNSVVLLWPFASASCLLYHLTANLIIP